MHPKTFSACSLSPGDTFRELQCRIRASRSHSMFILKNGKIGTLVPFGRLLQYIKNFVFFKLRGGT